MRKRAQRKSISVPTTEKHVEQKKPVKTPFHKMHSKKLVGFSLIAIFLLVLLLNTYFNATSGEPFNEDGAGFDKYYLAGPDPYYNMRLVNQTIYGEDPGTYPFYSSDDPLLNYPVGASGGRRPLLVMMSVSFSTLLTPFMDEVDALGYSMQFVPALFGALLVFPVYFIGKLLFNRKIGLLAAFFIVLIPIHLGSGHGSAYTLFDHDSFNLLLFFTTFLFLVKAIVESERTRMIIYSLLAGVSLAGVSMVWVEAQSVYTIIAVYAVVQMLIDIFRSKIDSRVPLATSITLFTGYLISLPVVAAKYGLQPDLPLFTAIGVAVFGLIYIFLKKRDIPWTLSLPSIFILAAAGVVFLYFVPTLAQSAPFLDPLVEISQILFGSGIYGSKVSLTIAEAGTYDISRTVMSFGIALFWLAWAGFFLIAYYYFKGGSAKGYIQGDHRRDHLFFLVLFLIQMWFIGVAGRFMNDLVPLTAIFSAWFIWYVLKRIDYKQMLHSIQSAGGGFHGIRRGVKFMHIFGILILALLVVLPNTYLSMDAATPVTEKEKVFGDLPNGAFGLSLGKEDYWVAAYEWFAQQDADIQSPVDRPGYISWWDYGFYEVAVGAHPTVADNFQDGIPPAANFETATSESQAVSIWVIRLLEGNAEKNNGILSANVKTVLRDYLGENASADIIQWVEDPKSAPSYDQPITPEYDPELSQDFLIGEQWPMNAVYQDGPALFNETLTEENLTMMYRDIQTTTGTSIRYYGVEGYDKQIFNIFAFLADKSLLLVAGRYNANPEDEFVRIDYVTQSGQEYTWNELKNRTADQNRTDPIVDTKTVYKEPYYETMFYRTYVGVMPDQSQQAYQLPCLNMRHFYARYVSPYAQYPYYQGQSAVVIAKYFEGAVVNGSVEFQNKTRDFQVIVQQNVTLYGEEIPLDHDTDTCVNGSYAVIVPDNNISIQIRRYPELGMNALPISTMYFNDDYSYPRSAITYDEATRHGDYNRTVDIEIQEGNLSGYVFTNNDNSSSYNASTDTPIANVNITIIGINKLDPETGQPTEYDSEFYRVERTNAEGYYNTSDLMPGYYQIIALTPEGFQIENTIIPIETGENSHNITKPKDGAVEGYVYRDLNENGLYDTGEAMKDVTVDLIYTTAGQKVVNSTKTDESGYYMFTSTPGDYLLNATKLPEYQTQVEAVINEEETTRINISLTYAKIDVSGTTRVQGSLDTVGNISISFNPDRTYLNNSAVATSAMSNSNGAYAVEMMPGYYNVSVDQQVNESGVIVTYTFNGKLHVLVGEGTKTYEILLSREV